MGQGEVPGDVAAVADVHNEVLDTGSEVANASAQPEGFQANEQNAPSAEPSFMDKAIGGAVDLATGAVGLVADAASGALDVASGATKGLIGAAADIASSAFNALTGGGAEQPQSQSGQQQNQGSGGLFSSLGNALNGLTGGIQTAFGTVANALSPQGGGATGNSTTLGGIFSNTLSSAFTKVGDVVGQAGNIMGGILGQFDGG